MSLAVFNNAKKHFHFVVITKEGLVKHHARENRTHSQDRKRNQHHSWTFMAIIVGVLVATRGSKEGEEHQTPAIKAGEQRGNHQHPKGVTAHCTSVSALNHSILRQKSRKAVMGQWDSHPSDCQSTDHHRPECIGHFFTQPPIVAHILLMMHAMDHRPST